ncbi:MAG TPA: outer membrane beta-barrel protein [Puia sp.]|nr:outer membrane beta-barrel protein [Puia sp.]
MLNLSDKDLDRLSREAAEQFEPGEPDSSWDKLSAMLDQEIGTEPPVSVTRYRISLHFYGVVALLVTGSVIFWLRSASHKTDTLQQTKQNSSLVNPANPSTTNGAAAGKESGTATGGVSRKVEHHAPNAQGGPDAATTPENNSGLAKDAQQEDVVHKNLGNPTAVTDAKNGSGIDNKAQHDHKNDHPASGATKQHGTAIGLTTAGGAAALQQGRTASGNDITGGSNKDLSARNGNQATAENAGGQKTIQNNHVTNNGPVSPSPLKYAAVPGVETTDPYTPYILLNDSALNHYNARANIRNTDIVHPNKNNDRSAYHNRALKIGLAAGPDYTNVKSATNNLLSSNIGVTLGYEFLHRWSINTGFMYTKKNYGANGEDFHGKPGYISNDSILFVQGNCSMFEIPLTIRYDFSTGKKTAFFVNGGVSSYLMKNENYQFYCSDPAWPNYVWRTGWQAYNNPQGYLFAVADLSAGIEQQLGKGFSFQAEPYARIPLKGVGVGSLQLSSYGIYFSIRYAPLLKTQRH